MLIYLDYRMDVPWPWNQCQYHLDSTRYYLQEIAYTLYQKTKSTKKMDFEDSKCTAQFPLRQLQNTSLVPNATPSKGSFGTRTN